MAVLSVIPQDAIVFHNNELRTTSLKVAEAFNKLHKDVLRKIESLDCSPEFASAHFYAHEEVIQAGAVKRPSKVYEMTKDGFMFLVFKFTGKKAAVIAENYINAFNLMAEKLLGQSDESIDEDGFNCLSSLIEGKTTKLPSKCRRSAQSKLWSQVHKAFGVRSGHDIPADQLSDVRNFIAAYAIEGEYLPSQGQSELGLYEKSLAEPFMGLDHLKLSGDRNIPDGRKLLKEMGKFMPAKAQPLLVELEATMVRQWTEVDESLHRIVAAQRTIDSVQNSMNAVQSSVNAAQTYMSRCRGQISELPDQI